MATEGWGYGSTTGNYVDSKWSQIRSVPQGAPSQSEVDMARWILDAARLENARRQSAEETKNRKIEKNAKEIEPMAQLYNVTVVTKSREILLDKKVVADSETEAAFEAGLDASLRAKGLKPKDVTVLYQSLGSVAVAKEPERVKIVTEEPAAAQ